MRCSEKGLARPKAVYPNNKPSRPRGKRLPDGIIWVHNLYDFYHVRSCQGLWSRSMIEDIRGKLPYNEKQNPRAPEPSPRPLDPWLPPNLYLPNKDGPINDWDGGTEFHSPDGGDGSGVHGEVCNPGAVYMHRRSYGIRLWWHHQRPLHIAYRSPFQREKGSLARYHHNQRSLRYSIWVWKACEKKTHARSPEARSQRRLLSCCYLTSAS